MRRYTFFVTISFCIIIYLLWIQYQNVFQQSNQPAFTVQKQTKFTNCKVQGPLPDPACTPGALFASVTKEQICKSGYSKSVRNVSENTKRQVYQEYGVTTRVYGEYEVDHFISLELGGSNDISTLWHEAAVPKPGFHEKDLIENYLHSKLCSGQMSLNQVQKEVSVDWLNFYQKMYPENKLENLWVQTLRFLFD